MSWGGYAGVAADGFHAWDGDAGVAGSGAVDIMHAMMAVRLVRAPCTACWIE